MFWFWIIVLGWLFLGHVTFTWAIIEEAVIKKTPITLGDLIFIYCLTVGGGPIVLIYALIQHAGTIYVFNKPGGRDV